MPEQDKLSHAMEDYLRAIYRIEERGDKVTTSALAEVLEVAPASVTKMLKRLAGMDLVEHEKYKGVMLAPKGKKAALEIVRHHRLLELFLAEVVGVPWDRVHEEAHRLEHALSEYLEDRLAALLNHPTVDPHGQPIPAKDGSILERTLHVLSEIREGESGDVAEVEDEDPDLLRYIAQHGLYPGTNVTLIRREPYGGGLVIKVKGEERIIGVEAARGIMLSLTHTEDAEEAEEAEET